MPADRPDLFRRVLADEMQLPLAIFAGAALVVGYALWTLVPAESAPMALLNTLGHALIWLSLAVGAVHGVKSAWSSLRRRRPDIDVLMVVGAGLAAAIGHLEEGALLLFMFTLAGALEHRALDRARNAVARLTKLMPANALVRRDDHWEYAQPEELIAGDVVLVRPGETVPADGLIIDGHSDLDQSSLTGESLPRLVGVGDDVFAGTINQNGALEVKVSRPVAESSIQRILKLVLEAQESRQPLQKLIDKFSTPYTITVFAAAIAAWIGFLAVGPGLSFAESTYRAITLLVVASPCALVIATPTATLCGLSRAARSGVLIKGGDALERLASVRQVALDKTGTLTTGRIEVTHVEPIGATDAESLLSIAMAAEQRSTHPIAAAIVRLARQHDLRPAELASLSNIPGRGLEGSFRGETVRIGDYEFCEPIIPICFRRHTQRIVEHIAAGGGKPVVIAHGGGGGHVLVLNLADTPREGAAELARALREVGVQNVTMLTGDTKVIAQRLAKQLGIENVHAELLPEEKVQQIRRLRESTPAPQGGELIPNGTSRGGLAVVGDGVNDAPGLAVADVGLAMGGIGADAALETADVVLLHDDLNRVPWSIGLARRVRRIMIANLAFATIVIATLATLTVILGIPLSLGVLGHEGSTLIVVANSLRLLAHRDP